MFWKELYILMEKNTDIWCLVGDLGFGGADQIRRDFPERFINCGASEFSMVGIAAGLALEGKIPVCYTITSFYLRAFEMIRTYVNHEKIPVILVGSGRDQEYAHDGYSHNASDMPGFFGLLPNIAVYMPQDKISAKETIRLAIKTKLPAFISLSKL